MVSQRVNPLLGPPVPLPHQPAWSDAERHRVRPLFRGAYLRVESRSVAHNARLFVTAVLADWRLLSLASDVQVCVSELVGNVVRHAPRQDVDTLEDRLVSVGLRCWVHGDVLLEVGDFSPEMPRLMRSADPFALKGRGLLIVDALSDRLWWRASELGGKTVYALFGLGDRVAPAFEGGAHR